MALPREALDDFECDRPAVFFRGDDPDSFTRSIYQVNVWILSWFFNGICLGMKHPLVNLDIGIVQNVCKRLGSVGIEPTVFLDGVPN